MTSFSDLILSTAHAQAPAGAPLAQPLHEPGPLGLMLLVVYFMIIRPQQRVREHQAQLDKLKAAMKW